MTLILQTPKKPNSYILTCKDTNLRDFILNQINKQSYFRTSVLRKHYTNENVDITENMIYSISNKIGKIIRELNNLGLVVKYNTSNNTLWKNLYKDNLFDEICKRLR